MTKKHNNFPLSSEENNMIKVQDLRIGNYLCYKENSNIWFEVGNLTSFPRRRIEAEGGGGVMDRAYEVGVEICDNKFAEFEVSGVPITQEWLELFGYFQHDQEQWLHKEIPFIVEDCLNFFSLIVSDSGKESGFAYLVNMKYIHELQNLVFTLTKHRLKRPL